jgi:hypothetical protein
LNDCSILFTQTLLNDTNLLIDSLGINYYEIKF